MKKKSLLFLLISIFFFIGTSYAMSLTLYNDSPYELTALIKSAGGKLLGQEILQPREERIWNTELSTSDDYSIEENVDQPEKSLTPYMVIWKCPYGGNYSIDVEVQPGAYVNANYGQGAHYCRPKKEKQKATEDSPPCSKEK